jgi:hypothetical protein
MLRLTPLFFGASLVGLVLLTSAGVSAQETRETTLLRKREEKAGQLSPNKKKNIERALYEVEERLLLERLFNPPRGLFVRVGGLTEGAGFGLGPAFRWSNAHVSWTTAGVVSVKRYLIAESVLALPHLFDDHVFAVLHIRRRDFPQEDFYGLGSSSDVDNRTNFAFRDTSVEGTGGFKPVNWLSVGGRLAYLAPSVGSGTDKKFPSLENVFDRSNVPGFIEQPAFVRTDAFLDFDARDPTGNPRAGVRYLLTYGRYNDRDFGRYSFRRVDADAQHYLPMLHRHRMLVLRALLATTDAENGHQVPFYYQPALGGAYTLRGFRTYRFRDRHALLLQAEYRYEVNPFLMGAIFYDAGKVVSRRGDLNFDDLERSYGFGLRVGGLTGVSLRTDLAFGSGEGTRLLIRFNNVF